jgi:hypothetical protein
MADNGKIDDLVRLFTETLDRMVAISAPNSDECDTQVELVVGLIKVAAGYAIASGMPTPIIAMCVQTALNETSAIARRVRAEREAQAQAQAPAAPVAPISDAQAREILAHLKDGGRVH